MENIKRCEYHNCNKVITGRKDKKYCNQKCRKYAHTYNKRELTKLKNEKSIYNKLIKEAQNLQDQNLIDLYKMIYG